MKKKLPIILIVILCLSILSCNNSKTVERKKKLYLILFDISVSVKEQEMLKSYIDNFKIIVTKVQPGDLLIAGLISERSISELNFPIKYESSSFVSSIDNTLYSEAEEKKFNNKFNSSKDSLLKKVDNFLHSNKISLQTDIFSSLQLAEKVFNSYKDFDKVLILMSDMIESTPTYNFYTEKFTDDKINAIIERNQQDGSLPNLEGIKVYITGASYNTPERYNQIQNFWMHYFQKCKANLSKNNYNSALINFNE